MWSPKKLFLVLFSIIITYYFILIAYWRNSKEEKSDKFRGLFEFDSEITKNNKNIFFIETSCFLRSKDRPLLNPRQACAIYSTAVKNPNHSVFLLYSCFFSKKLTSGFVEKVLQLPNVSIKWINIRKTLKGINVINPILHKLSISRYSIEHSSDILRVYLLYKYGGTYMDLDVVCLKPVDQLGHNYVGLERQNPGTLAQELGSAIINFKYDGIGHELMETALKTIGRDYDMREWTGTGPIILQKVIREFCREYVKKNSLQIPNGTTVGKLASCGITVHPHYYFYPILWKYWMDFVKYNNENNTRLMNKLNNTYVVHVWNHMGKTKIRVGSNQLYGLIAQRHCAPIYWHSGEYF